MNTTRTITICFVFPLSFALSEDCDSAAVVCGAAVSAAAGIVQKAAAQEQCSQQSAKASFPTLPHGFSPVWTASSQTALLRCYVPDMSFLTILTLL
ncbi:MAG: hypothetical protein ACLR5S_03130 [Ruminococcus sp.]